MIENPLDKRPVIVAIAGPNGAGKTTFFHSHLREAGLRFVKDSKRGTGQISKDSLSSAILKSRKRDRSNKGLSAIEFEKDDFLQVGRPISPRPGAAVSQMVDGLPI